jgi:hypothetical protein
MCLPQNGLSHKLPRFEGAAHQATSSHIKHRALAHQTHIKPRIKKNSESTHQRPGLRGVFGGYPHHVACACDGALPALVCISTSGVVFTRRCIDGDACVRRVACRGSAHCSLLSFVSQVTTGSSIIPHSEIVRDHIPSVYLGQYRATLGGAWQPASCGAAVDGWGRGGPGCCRSW